MSRSLSQWIDYIQTLHARSIDLGLDRVSKVWNRFKPPQLPVTIAVAGTNGKGSSVSMLESVYRHAGYRTGAFTSPHLVDFNERFRINNRNVADQDLLASFIRIEAWRGDVTLTFFEFNTLLALDIFIQADLQVILLEVGLGGRLDAVNIVENDLALITAIGIDHTAWLGTDRSQIGAEKAGIIKAKARAVIADPKAPGTVSAMARDNKADFVCADTDYKVNRLSTGEAEFRSSHGKLSRFDGIPITSKLTQVQDNTAGVIATIAMLQYELQVSGAQLQLGLEKQQLAGRLQLIDGTPKILLDVSHNEDSVLAMIRFIDTLQHQAKLHAVFGALADKSYDQAYDALKQRVDHWYLASLSGERGQTSSALYARLFDPPSAKNEVRLFDQAEDAFQSALSAAEQADLIVIFGSFHLVGAIIPVLNR